MPLADRRKPLHRTSVSYVNLLLFFLNYDAASVIMKQIYVSEAYRTGLDCFETADTIIKEAGMAGRRRNLSGCDALIEALRVGTAGGVSRRSRRVFARKRSVNRTGYTGESRQADSQGVPRGIPILHRCADPVGVRAVSSRPHKSKKLLQGQPEEDTL